MKIALFGYGKMGKTIEKIAEERGHQIVHKITGDPEKFDLKMADVAIDFSIPSAALQNIGFSLQNAVPVVSGTTGWLQDYEKAVEICKKEDSAFIYASNFSPGMNIFFELNKKLAEMMNSTENYSVEIEETHHLQKLDAPSGTAITLAEQIIQKGQRTAWVLGEA
ncbi:MAG TPA: dihydrodipicolinate reductase C-terminal domain-containing protein, partial [Salinimicrobium sp.]|nr:dihydrodipicolinate reductase C-terminal domain-containing protein [Salinimicrobium sp.]